MAYRLLFDSYTFPESLTYNLVSFRSAVPSAKLPRAHGARVPRGYLAERRIEIRGLLKKEIGGDSLQSQIDDLRAALMSGPATLYLPNGRHLRLVQKDDGGQDRYDQTWPERIAEISVDLITGDPFMYSDTESSDVGNPLGGGGEEEEAFFLDTFTDTDETALQDHTPDVGGPWLKYDNGISSPLDMFIETEGPTDGAAIHDPADFPDSGNAYSGAIYYVDTSGGLPSYTIHVDIVIDAHPGDSDWSWEMCLIANLHPTSSSVVSGHFLEINYDPGTDTISVSLVAIDPTLSGTNLTPGGSSMALADTATVRPARTLSLEVTETAGDYHFRVLDDGVLVNDGADFECDDTSGDVAVGGDFGMQVVSFGWSTFGAIDKIPGFIDRVQVVED